MKPIKNNWGTWIESLWSFVRMVVNLCENGCGDGNNICGGLC